VQLTELDLSATTGSARPMARAKLEVPEVSDLTVKILRGIRDEIRALRTETSERLDSMNQHLDSTNERLDSTNQRLDRLDRRQVETETRRATELVAVVGAIHELRDAVLEDRQLRATVGDHEQRIAALERSRDA
jgi:hypothetical protein